MLVQESLQVSLLSMRFRSQLWSWLSSRLESLPYPLLGLVLSEALLATCRARKKKGEALALEGNKQHLEILSLTC